MTVWALPRRVSCWSPTPEFSPTSHWWRKCVLTVSSTDAPIQTGQFLWPPLDWKSSTLNSAHMIALHSLHSHLDGNILDPTHVEVHSSSRIYWIVTHQPSSGYNSLLRFPNTPSPGARNQEKKNKSVTWLIWNKKILYLNISNEKFSL